MNFSRDIVAIVYDINTRCGGAIDSTRVEEFRKNCF
jgi:hypothetical protein